MVVYVWMQAGCAEVVVPGTLAGAGEYYRYTTSNVAKKTLIGNVDQVNAAAEGALKKMNMRLDSVESDGYETCINAATAELDITIAVNAITATTTKISVDAVKDRVFKDKATADEILSQIQVELDRGHSSSHYTSKVFVQNNCRLPVDVIVYYLDGKNEPESWQTRGWFSVVPNQKKYIADTHNRYVYLYGETRQVEKITWSGEILQWFEGKRYGFFRVDMGTTQMDYTQSFSCE